METAIVAVKFRFRSIVVWLGLDWFGNLILLVLNAIDAIAYVCLSSFGWVIPGEPFTAEPFIWAMAIAPAVAVGLLINVPWAVVIVRHKDWSTGRLWALVAMLWLVALAIDFAHH